MLRLPEVCRNNATGLRRRTSTMSEPRYPADCVERFLEYVTIDTQSSESVGDLSRAPPGSSICCACSSSELQELGLDDVEMDEHGYVFATIPATTDKKRRADDRFHRARRHVARDERRRSQADRPRELPGPGPRAARRPDGGASARGQPASARADRQRHHHRLGDDAARAPTTRPAWPRSWARRSI